MQLSSMLCVLCLVASATGQMRQIEELKEQCVSTESDTCKVSALPQAAGRQLGPPSLGSTQPSQPLVDVLPPFCICN